MKAVTVRFSEQRWNEFRQLLFSRYPHQEWATWTRFGWRIADEALIFTVVAIDPPEARDLDPNVSHVAIQESYSLRVALAAEHHEFAVGVAHSHPQGCLPIASPIDDDMDSYYADYLSGFTSGRPYPSLILSEVDGDIIGSGRVWFEGQWLPVTQWIVEGVNIPMWAGQDPPQHKPLREGRVGRLTSVVGRKAAQRIRDACVAVVGASGTGSPAIEVLARAGVGHLIVVDPDAVEESNLERLHGGYSEHVEQNATKVEVARAHVAAIDADIRFEGYVGRVPQARIVDALARANVILGCTDQQHSRLALSEISFRYLVPLIDCGVSLEGANGRITGQTIQLVHFKCESPCVLCRNMIDHQRVSQELMSAEERASRRAAAADAERRGEKPDPYWQREAQLNTVGYLTTAAGALAAGNALGILTGTFEPGFSRMQLNAFNAPVDLVDWRQDYRSNCVCRRVVGYADLAIVDRLITPPGHWPAVEIVR